MNRMVLKAAVLSISLLCMSAPAVSPALASISANFPDINPNTIMLIVSLPSMSMVIFSLAFGKLTEIMKKRTIISIAAVLFVVGGIAPAFSDNITSILILRGIFGVSLGLLLPLSAVLVTDFFEGSERECMMGLQSASINLGGIIFPLLGGLLAAMNWHYTFFSYIFGALVFLFVFFCLPEPKRIEILPEGVQSETQSISLKAWIVIVSFFVYNIGLMAFISNVAMKISQDKLGDAASAGFALAIFTGGGLITGLLFGNLIGILQKYTVAAGWLTSGIGFILLAVVHDFYLLLAGCILSGMGFAVTMPGTFVQLSNMVSPAAISYSFAMVYSAMGLGQFAAPIFFEFINGIFGQGPGSFPIMVAGIGMACIGLISLLIILIQSNDKESVVGKNLQ